MWGLFTKFLTWGFGSSSARLPALLGLAGAALLLLLLGGYAFYGQMRVRSLEASNAKLSASHSSLQGERDAALAALAQCRQGAEMEGAALLRQRQEQEQLQSRYNALRRTVAEQLLAEHLPADGLPALGEAAPRAGGAPGPAGVELALPKAPAGGAPVAGTRSATELPKNLHKELDYEASFKEWCAQPVPDFVGGLFRPAAPAAARGSAPAGPAASNAPAPEWRYSLQ